MRKFLDSNTLLAKPDILRKRLADTGYLYFPGLVDAAPLKSLAGEISAIMVDQGWIDPSAPEEFRTVRSATVEGDDDHFGVYGQIQKLESFNALPHRPEIKALMSSVFDGPNFVHPLSIARLTFPFAEDFSTPAHQDFPNNQGTPDLYACWIPLHDCPVSRGPLKILCGSNRFGLRSVDYSLGAGAVTTKPDPRLEALEWHGGDMSAGDVLVFHSHTVHAAQPNQTDVMRVSVDYRFQRDGDALTAGCLLPHFNRLSWDEIYQGWESDELKFYWEDHPYEVVEFDPSIRAIPEEQSEESIMSIREFRQRQIDLAEAKGWPVPQEYVDILEAERQEFLAIPGFAAAFNANKAASD